ncbi:MAG: extracellular solute-binding protein [Planctomycetota bacterium]|nr:extracellular solute-binding protein [Planctomycetota bacterium]
MSAKMVVLVLVVLIAAAVALAWVSPPKHGVVVYTSVDSEFAKPLAERFERATGIPVVLRTDSEISKTTGMLGRLRELKDRPDGDVFWNSELSATLLLARDGLLTPYVSPAAAAIPADFKDAQGLWTGFGCRARVLVFNTERVKKEDAPKRLEDLTDPKWRGRFCMARPMFGTTRSHLVSLVLAMGEEQGLAFLRKLRENATAGAPARPWIVDGNSAVRERVAEGVFDLGLTDTDDVYVAQDRNRPVDLVMIGQTETWPGVYLIPNTVGLIAKGPNPEAGKKFIDFLLRPETEAWLAEQGARQIPVRAEVPVPAGRPKLADLTAAKVDAAKLQAEIERLSETIDKLVRGEIK